MKWGLIAAGALMATAAAPASAADFSFVGALSNPNEVQFFDFVVGATSTVTFKTYSYAGGVNQAGATIVRGGFDPILALFDSTGALINFNDDDPSSPADSVTGAHFDVFLQEILTPGTYRVSVTAFANFPETADITDGYSQLGSFTDVTGDNRDSHWAFDILNVAQATNPTAPGVPEPATWAMMIAGFGLVGATLRRRQRVSVSFG